MSNKMSKKFIDRFAQLVDAAKSEGNTKQFISEELKSLPRYGVNCECGIPERYIEQIEDVRTPNFRLMCLRCGGMVFA